MDEKSDNEVMHKPAAALHANFESLLPMISNSCKWHGSVQVPVKAPVDAIWNITGDFCGLKKWILTMDVCERVEGEEQVPGCVRYCCGESVIQKSSTEKLWVKERLIELDSENHRYTYTMIEGNRCLEEYVGTFHVYEEVKGDSTVVEWRFELKPLDGFTEQEFVTAMTSKMAVMIKALEKHLIEN